MRGEADRAKLQQLMAAIGERASGPGVIYLTAGATGLLFGWRRTTIDVDIKPDPEPPGLSRLIEPEMLAQLFRDIQPRLIRYPGIDVATFERVVREFCDRGDA
jgi:hypothetical protein